MTDALFEPAKVLMLVPERLARRSAAFSNPFRELDHLVNRLLAIEPHDVLITKPAALFLSFARPRRQHLHEHGNHHFGPALADERERTVEIKQHMADSPPRGKARRKFHPAPKLPGERLC